eukprot:scaffold9901_cov65-Phaeocystis_antarctica.AAC.5
MVRRRSARTDSASASVGRGTRISQAKEGGAAAARFWLFFPFVGVHQRTDRQIFSVSTLKIYTTTRPLHLHAVSSEEGLHGGAAVVLMHNRDRTPPRRLESAGDFVQAQGAHPVVHAQVEGGGL